MSDVTVTDVLDSRANLATTMNKIGTFTFTTGEPIRLHGFSQGAAVSWAQNKDIQKQIKDEIEHGFDVFSDTTYPYEDYYRYVEAGFLQGIKEAESINDAAANWAGLEAVAELSALDRPDLEQDKEKIIASYFNGLKNDLLAVALLSEAGITVDVESRPERPSLNHLANEAKKLHDT